MDRNLHNFLIVAESGSFTRASNEHGISQPALSKSIQKLEDLYGVALFERVSRGVLLTEFGEILLRRARAVRNELDYVREEIANRKRGSNALIRIGCGPVWAMTLIPDILTTLGQEFEGFRAEVIMSHRETLVEHLERRELDVAVCGALDKPDNPAIGFEALSRVRSIILARASHPVFDEAEVTAEVLNRWPWTNLLRNQFLAHPLDPATRRIPEDPHVMLNTNSVNVALIHASRSDNLLIVPEAMAQVAELHGLRPVPFAQTIREFSSGLFYLKSSRNQPVVRRFVQMVRAWDQGARR